MDISGKIAIVSGAAAGIGRATAVALAKAGAKGVVIIDIDDTGMAETKKAVEANGAEGLVINADVTKQADLENIYAETDSWFGQIDIVFNNAGIVSGPPPYPDSSLERIKLVIDIDLIAVIQSSTLAIRYMRDHGGGVIVNTASTGALNPLPSDAQYAASKAGVLHFGTSCESFAEEYGVRVNTVCPGVTETAILEKTGGGKRPDWLGPILENIKVLQPEDIADVVLDIIRDDSMAGQHVVVENEARAGAS
jgi:NAD(P)-dependent dehydrogenase (short-subunit alcohol dehydrogenase family)